ncbi:BamA/TamA family outer membrane protein [Mongoliitalea daihaiensis]|uniref:BamA/TamA family outer membrane protein n=1 Tax=Mongoliitalea daihaiensis TaxID=2782006 RepID=UPI001F40754D|nr:BamA/TamA family outer membrane protein [Mongoliitalea daihaiensis]UJP64488.1 BamA/TamA family outer membrane protein [Mongoliitalea daihaiensis]
MNHLTMRLWVLFLLQFIASVTFGGQDSTQVTKKEKSISIVPLPAISANPTAGLILGMAPSFNWVMGNPESTSMSTAIGMALVTTKRQLFTSLRSNVFLRDDSWTLLTDFRFNINNQPSFGLGSTLNFVRDLSPPDLSTTDILGKEMLFFNHFRAYGTAKKRLGNSRFFYGLGFHYDAMSKIDVREQNFEELPGFFQAYNEGLDIPTDAFRQTGFSLNAVYDTRDNVANTYKGKYLFASWRGFSEALGSTSNSGQLWVEYRDYLTLNKERPRNILALWSYVWTVTGGDVPYLFLPAVGWDMFSRSGRGYTQGRFRGEDLFYTELEWRFPLQRKKDRWGGTLFANTTSASSRTQDLGILETFQLGYGLGLRYMVLPKKRINIALDYGWGAGGASGIFLNVNEMF